MPNIVNDAVSINNNIHFFIKSELSYSRTVAKYANMLKIEGEKILLKDGDKLLIELELSKNQGRGRRARGVSQDANDYKRLHIKQMCISEEELEDYNVRASISTPILKEGDLFGYDAVRRMYIDTLKAYEKFLAGAAQREEAKRAMEEAMKAMEQKTLEKKKLRQAAAAKRSGNFANLMASIEKQVKVENVLENHYANLVLPNNLRVRIAADVDDIRILDIDMPTSFKVDQLAQVKEVLTKLAAI